METKEKKILTEFYVKNIVVSLFEPNLGNMNKEESPDFFNNNCSLEITTLVEQDVAEPHALFEVYKGQTINSIPNKVFEKSGCDKRNIEKLEDGALGIRNCFGELKFIFDKDKRYIAYYHNPIYVAKMIGLLYETLLNKQKKLNNIYERKTLNYLGVYIPNNFFIYKEEQTIQDFLNTEFYKNKLSKNELLFFDKVFIVFVDYAFEIDMNKKTTRGIGLDEIRANRILNQSRTETENYLTSLKYK